VVEDEAVALPRGGVPEADGVGEAAGAVDDGRRPVAQAVHLVEPARLVPRRHQEQVAPCLDEVREGLAEGPLVRHLPRKGVGELREEALVFLLAGAEHHHLHRAPAERVREHVEAQVEALLPRHPRHHPHHRDAGDVWEPHRAAELLLVALLAREVVGGVAVGDAGVALGAPLGLVDAVEHAAQHVTAVAEEGVQPDAVLGRADLPRVGRRHRGDGVGVEDPREQVVDPPLAELVLMEVLGRVAEASLRQNRRAEAPLVPDVVDREDGAGAREEAVPCEEGLEREGSERGLPVVAVDDVGRPLKVLTGLERRPGEPGEARGLVGVAGVERRAVEERGRAHEVDGDVAARERSAHDGEARAPRPQRERERREHLGERAPRRADAGVEGHHDAHVVAALAEVAGERAGDVAEAAGLREGGDFRADEEDVHG